MTQKPADGEPVHLDFLLYLRGRGFAVSVDQYLRAQALVDEYTRARPSAADSPDDDDTLKTLLCPLFARDRKQQEKFHGVFDDYVAHVERERERPRGPRDDEERVLIPPPPWWEPLAYACAILLLLAAAALPAWLASRADTPTLTPNVNNNGNVNPDTNTNADANVSAGDNTRDANGDNRNRGGSRNDRNRIDEGRNDAANVNAVTSNVNAPTPTPEPVPTKQVEVPPPPPRHYYLLAVVLPFSFYLLSELVIYLRRKLVLGRRPPRRPPAVWPLRIKSAPPRLYDSEEFHEAARHLRRRQVGEYHRLDIAATVSATVAALGFPAFRYRPDSKVPEYLVLVDRASFRDHQARLFDELARALQREGLFLTRLFYNGDPRVCCDESGVECLQLSEMQNRYAGQRLLVFGDGDALIDASTGRLAAWAGMFSEWQERALFTPAPRWGLREKTLADLFTVAPATPEGVAVLAARFESLVVDNLPLWPRGDSAPPEGGGPQLASALREHLGARVFRWLSACAVYPELQWELTLSLGSLASVGGGVPFDEADLLRLARLPWFRAGSMPDDVRWLLVEELGREDPAALAEVRAALVGFLERESPPEGSIASDRHALELAVQRWLLGRDEESLARLRETLREVRPGQILKDRTLVRHLERLPNTLLDLVLPRRLRKLFFRHGLPLLGTRTLGRFLLTLLVASAALLAVWSRAIPYTPDKPPPTPTPTPTPSTTPTATPTPPVIITTESPTPPPPADTTTLELDIRDDDDKQFGGTVNITLFEGQGDNVPTMSMGRADASRIISGEVPENFDTVEVESSTDPSLSGKAYVNLRGKKTVRVKVMMRGLLTQTPTPTPPTPPTPTPTPTPPPRFTVTGVNLRLAFQSINGPCPDTLAFAGEITASGPGTVTYRFVRSDGGTSAEQSLTFDGPGTKIVSTIWTLGGPDLLSYKGWVMLEVITPQRLQSGHADFTMTCRDAEDTIIDSVSVTFHTTTNKKNKGDSITVRLLDDGRDEGGVNSVGADEDWAVGTTKTLTFGNLRGDVSYKGCGMVLVVSKSDRSSALGGRPPFVTASLQKPSTSGQADSTGRQHHKWAMWVSAVVTLSDGRTLTLLPRSQDFVLGEGNPNAVRIPLPCR